MHFIFLRLLGLPFITLKDNSANPTKKELHSVISLLLQEQLINKMKMLQLYYLLKVKLELLKKSQKD